MRDDFFSAYLQYTAGGECPTFFHRWCAIAGIGALLGRNYYFQFGHNKLHTNPYCMLVGSPGTKKSTAIKLLKSVLKQAGYDTIAASKTSKEKFLVDLSGESDLDVDSKSKGNGKGFDVLNDNLWGTTDGEPAEVFIMADEFNEFLGTGNTEFASMLGDLWDFHGPYDYRIKSGKSIRIFDPTVSLLGGNTPTGISMCFPSDIIGQGFFSRLLLIYAEPNGVKVTFPPTPTPEATEVIVKYLQRIRTTVVGKATMSPAAEALLDKIYKSYKGIDDARFDAYCGRRFPHLLKLCLIFSASRLSTEISCEDIVHANTVLSFTEHLMPKSLGEFGKAKNAGASHKLLQMLEASMLPMSITELWKGVSNDLDKMQDLSELLRKLLAADKIQAVDGSFLPKKKVLEEVVSDILDYRILTDEEKRIGL